MKQVMFYSQKFDMHFTADVLEERKYTLKLRVQGIEEKDCRVIIKKRKQVSAV